ncbi:zona pellucida-like domain-containing protein 1 [Spea bombifrons]|uniref:zona pellucida-like domain-containing protein 1 n=1 Tax=Spea bombifrons TaxID=233779 RepID=UPI00234BAFF7|nr:zona pellucida-like domain-containing protein 1 [Spea bombifrons]
MWFPLLLLLIISTERYFVDACSSAYDRLPDNSDIAVTCGPKDILLSINACPVWYANFNPLELALNGKHNVTECLGVMNNSTGSPFMEFILPVDDTSGNKCGNIIQIIEGAGSGAFSDYSNIQTVAISGFVDSPSAEGSGLVTFSTNLYYNFSCYYPLQYMLNNTQLLTSFGAVAVNSNNGSFISTLSMQLFTDQELSNAVPLNGTVYPLRQKVYVQVSLNNPSTSFNVMLDHCFATPSPMVTLASPSDKYSLFTGCNVQNRTSVISNGRNKTAKFSFETFRFVQHSGQKTSSIYLHCVTRLCLPDKCLQYLEACTGSRRKRAAAYDQSTVEAVTVSSGPIYTSDKASGSSSLTENADQEAKNLAGTLTGLIVGLIIAAITGAAIVIGSIILYKMYRRRAAETK